jgi:sec-independent protein translocase protein TatA
MTLLFLDIGGGELVVILLVIVMFFGADKIPEMARGLGKGMRQFKDATGSIQREIEKSIDEAERNITAPNTEAPQTPVAKAPENSMAQKPADSTVPKQEEEAKQ